MGKKALHVVGRGIFQMEKAKIMGPDGGNESRLSLPVGVGNDKRVDHKNKASSDRSVNVFWDPSRGMMVERSCVYNPQMAIRKNRTNAIHFAGYNKCNFEGAVCPDGF